MYSLNLAKLQDAEGTPTRNRRRSRWSGDCGKNPREQIESGQDKPEARIIGRSSSCWPITGDRDNDISAARSKKDTLWTSKGNTVGLLPRDDRRVEEDGMTVECIFLLYLSVSMLNSIFQNELLDTTTASGQTMGFRSRGARSTSKW